MNPVRVVLIDDDPFFLKLLAKQLAGQGVTAVEICTSGAAALAMLETGNTQGMLLFLDLKMPDMDGVEFVRKLADLPYAGALAMMSGEDHRVLETASRLASAHNLDVLGHLKKPIEPLALQALLGRASPAARSAQTRTRKAYPVAEIRRALEQGELTNFYQPQVNVTTGTVEGVEALVRWKHPDDGLVFPDQFIAAAESGGLIDDLTQVVLSGALVQARRWQEEGFALRVAVNVSMENLTRLDFADVVGHQLARHGASPSSLVLEVTESRLMSDPITPLDILTRLRLKRISLSIDDFGTGHSSLAQLRDLPFDELKIDRGFVHGAVSDETRRAILCGSLDMARRLGMKTVAEGVEDEADWELLRQEGCNLAQGYFIARPMPGAEIPVWLGQWSHRFGVPPPTHVPAAIPP